MCLRRYLLTTGYIPFYQHTNHIIDSRCHINITPNGMSENGMRKLIYVALIAASISPFTALAANDQQDMEHMSVLYRAPLEYAAYQYTAEMLSNFNLQLLADIYVQARMSSLQMAKEQSLMSNKISMEQQHDKSLASTGVMTSAE